MKEIKLSQGKVALVDDADYGFINQWKWSAVKDRNSFYAFRNKGITRMHRLILFVSDPKIIVGHRDLDGLNNQRDNLRICTSNQSRATARSSINSSSKFKGVYHNKDGFGKYVVRISNKKKSIYIGTFTSEVKAALAYDNAAKELHGEFANLNFKPDILFPLHKFSYDNRTKDGNSCQ